MHTTRAADGAALRTYRTTRPGRPSQLAVAQRLQVSRVTINRWERHGTTHLKAAAFRLACDQLGAEIGATA